MDGTYTVLITERLDADDAEEFGFRATVTIDQELEREHWNDEAQHEATTVKSMKFRTAEDAIRWGRGVVFGLELAGESALLNNRIEHDREMARHRREFERYGRRRW